MAQVNDLDFVIRVLSMLEGAGIHTWLLGGWAEELRGLRLAGAHRDVDLLYPAESLEEIDRFLIGDSAAEEILPKRFSHKRAFELDGIMVEVTLVQQAGGRYVTRYFSGLHTVQWPADTFQWLFVEERLRLPVVSGAALRCSREHHTAVQQAYLTYRK